MKFLLTPLPHRKKTIQKIKFSKPYPTMRKTEINNDGLKVQTIAGTYVVVLGINLPEDKCAGLKGFSIHRVDHIENEAYYLEGMKTFTETDPGFPAGSLYSTKDQPIQGFQWADYSAKPGYHYT